MCIILFLIVLIVPFVVVFQFQWYGVIINCGEVNVRQLGQISAIFSNPGALFERSRSAPGAPQYHGGQSETLRRPLLHDLAPKRLDMVGRLLTPALLCLLAVVQHCIVSSGRSFSRLRLEPPGPPWGPLPAPPVWVSYQGSDKLSERRVKHVYTILQWRHVYSPLNRFLGHSLFDGL